MNDNKDIMVTICTITYNHEKYIEQTILSVLAQKHGYKFEFVIGDDGSRDKTTEIINKYVFLYPDIIIPCFLEKNHGGNANEINCLQYCRGKYIAYLEGDDYWTDPHKLKKQLSFMEANPDFSLCFSDVDIVDDIGLEYPNPFPAPVRDELTIEDVIMSEKVFIPTPTILFRNVMPYPLPDFFKQAMSGDIALHLMLGDKGKIKYMPGKSAIYRQHRGGVTKSIRHITQSYKELFKLYVRANKYYNYKYNTVFRDRLSIMSKTLLVYFSKDKKGIEKVKYVLSNTPNYFKYSKHSLKETVYYFLLLFFPSILKKRKKH